jgi:TonB family protein
MKVLAKNAGCINKFFAIILAVVLIFIIISVPTRTVFAQQVDNTVQSQKQAEKQEYPGPDEFVIVDNQPVLKYAPEPAYPEEALKAKIEGSVWLKVLVDSHGDVVKAIIAKDSEKDAGFEESALENAKLRKYEPAEKDGKPVAAWIAYKVAFKLK